MNKTNNPNFAVVFSVVAIMIAIGLGCGRFGGFSLGDDKAAVKDTTVPTIDPDEPIPALSADALDALVIDMPELAKYRDEILAAERDAIKGALEDLRSKAEAGRTKSAASNELRSLPSSAFRTRNGAENSDAPVGWINALFDAPWVTVAVAAEDTFAGALQQQVIGHQITFFVPDRDSSPTGAGSKTVPLKNEKTGKVEAIATMSIDSSGGPATLELATDISLPLFGLDAGSKVSVKGYPCPDAEGNVDLHIKLVTNARRGKAGSVFYDKGVEARIRATVGDDANLIGADFETRQATHATTGGQQVDFITSKSRRVTGDHYGDSKDSEPKLERGSQFVSPADQKASDDGLANAFNLAIGALEGARHRWQGGGCIEIMATSPGSVATDSSTQIPVEVRHKHDRSAVSAKLDAVLVGGSSIDPIVIPKTRGTLTYIAPGEPGKTATIKLKATSRRGIADLDLTASTGGFAYRISGGLDEWQTNTVVCDIMKPFTLSGTNGIKMNFSGGMSGSYKYSGTSFGAQGSGTYEMSFPAGQGKGKNGTMVGRGPGTVKGGGATWKGSGTENYSMYSVDGPCVDGPAE